MPEIINPTIFLNDYLDSIKAKIRAEVGLLKSYMPDYADIVLRMTSEYRIAPVVVSKAEPSAPQKKSVRRGAGQHQYDVPVLDIKVTIPYTGDKILLNCRPATYSRVFIRHRHQVYSNLITVHIELEKLDPVLYEKELSEFISEATKNLERTNNQVSFFNDDLHDFIKVLVKKQMEELGAELDFMEKIGLSINPKSDQFMVPNPIVRKVIPQPVTDTSPAVPRKLIPTLQENVYNDIREVIYNVGRAMERKPSLYRGKHEEHIRDMFLLFLETRYDATSGVGEAFNKSGKTDILLKYAKDGTNIFVAECKIWKGQKKFAEAISQLLGYLTYRDSKTALMTFVRQQDFSAVLTAARQSIMMHAHFKRFVRDTYNSSFAFEIALPQDPQNIVAMEFMFFHFPD